MRKKRTRWSFFVAVAAGVMLGFASNAAIANCTQAENARINAGHPRQLLLIRRVQRGDCSSVPELLRITAAANAILSDTERRIKTGNNPLRCYMSWKRLPTISACGCKTIGHTWVCDSSATQTAKAAPPTPAPAIQPVTQPTARHWQGTSDPADCANANSVERSSAAWGNICVRDANAPRQNPQAPAAARPAAQPPVAPPVVAVAPAQVISPNQNPTRPSSGASASHPGAPPSSADEPGGGPYRPTLTKADCDGASPLDKSTYAYWLICHEGMDNPEVRAKTKVEAERRERERYKIPVDSPVAPQNLIDRADAACPLGQNMNLRQQQQCIQDIKVSVLLKEEPNVRNLCTRQEAYGRDSLIACVETVYLYGPKGLQQSLRDSLGGATVVEKPMTEWQPPPGQLERVDLCPLGYGLQPGDPSTTFGAWTCQSLVMTVPERGTVPAQAGGPADEENSKLDFEKWVNRVSEMVVIGVADGAGAKIMSAEDRKTCMDESYAAVRSVLKGGSPPMSDMCRGIVYAAIDELARYADPKMHIDTRNPGGELLLGYLTTHNPKSGGSAGGNLGPPQPGMMGLVPDAQNRRTLDCVEAEMHWRSAEDIKTLLGYQDHLAKFPNCNFAVLAKARIEALQKK